MLRSAKHRKLEVARSPFSSPRCEIVDSLKITGAANNGLGDEVYSNQLSRNAARLVWKEQVVLASLGGHH